MALENRDNFYAINPRVDANHPQRAKYYTQPACERLEGRFNNFIFDETNILSDDGEIVQSNGRGIARFYSARVVNLDNWQENPPVDHVPVLVKAPYQYKENYRKEPFIDLGETNGLVLAEGEVFVAKPILIHPDTFQIMRLVRNDFLIADLSSRIPCVNYQDIFSRKLQNLHEQLRQRSIILPVWNYYDYRSPE